MLKNLNVDGKIDLPGSKSILNRILIISTFLKKPLRIVNYSRCSDVVTIVKNLRFLGFNLEEADKHYQIFKPVGEINNNSDLYIDGSGTAFRFLLARLSSLEGITTHLDISPGLRKRPIEILIQALRELGAEIGSNRFPLVIRGCKLRGGEIELQANISSQFASALVLIAPVYERDLILKLNGRISSRSYLDMTIALVKEFGIEVEFDGDTIHIPAGQKYKDRVEFTVEPDYSSAAYFWTLGALNKGRLLVSTTGETSLQPDHGFPDILEKFGAKVIREPGLIGVTYQDLIGGEFEMGNMPDQVPTLAVLGLLARNRTRIMSVGHLEFKESKRLTILEREFKKLGAKIRRREDFIEIEPLKSISGYAVLDPEHDHRLAMAFHLLKTQFSQIEIKDISCIAKSFPEFSDIWGRMQIS